MGDIAASRNFRADRLWQAQGWQAGAGFGIDAGGRWSAPGTGEAELLGRWVLPGYHDAPADAARLQALLDRLTSTPRGFPVAKTPDARERFKVADKDYERRLVASVGDKPAAVLYVGAAQGLRKSTARTAQDDVVYAVDLPLQDLATTPGEWLDAGMLKPDVAGLTEIAIAAKDKAGKVWLAVTNVDPNRPATITATVAGVKARAATGETLTAPKVDSVNSFEAPNTVVPKPITAKVEGGAVTLTVEPKSVTVVSVEP